MAGQPRAAPAKREQDVLGSHQSAELRAEAGLMRDACIRPLEHYEVEPFHLLLGCLHVPDSFAARLLAELSADGELRAFLLCDPERARFARRQWTLQA